MEININIQSIQEDLSMKSSFVGRYAVDNEGNILYDKIKITKQDDPIILGFINDAKESLKAYISEFIYSDSDNKIILSLPDSFNDAYELSVKINSINYIKNIAFSKWLNLRYKEESPVYVAYAKENMDEITRLLYSREKPMKRIWML